MLKKFDADGDGKLSVEERREAIKQAKFGEKKSPPTQGEGKPSKSKKKKGDKKKGGKPGKKGQGKKPKEKKKDS
jgi:hypothetical protein